VRIAAWQQDRNARGAARGIVTAASTDSGGTWQLAQPQHLTICTKGRFVLASDPIVSIGADHRAYLATIGVDAEGGDAVIVSTSTDHGIIWSDPVTVAASAGPHATLDKETILADPTSPGVASVVWVVYGASLGSPDSNAAFVSRTTDGGRTWSSPSRVYGANSETQFHQLGSQADGTLLDAFIEARSLSGHPPPPIPARIAVTRSTDAGRTWSDPVTAAELTFTEVIDPTGKDRVRASGVTIALAVTSAGTAYVAWAEEHLVGESTISVARSDDGGLTWGPAVVAVRSPRQVFLPALAVTGDERVGLLWYQFGKAARGTPLATDVWFAWSRDRASTWTAVRVAGSFDLHSAPLTREGDFVGDYVGLAGLGAGFAAVFVMAKPKSASGPTDVFAARIALP
jgi:hypothetical protein